MPEVKKPVSCRSCNAGFVAIVRMDANILDQTCPACGSPELFFSDGAPLFPVNQGVIDTAYQKPAETRRSIF